MPGEKNYEQRALINQAGPLSLPRPYLLSQEQLSSMRLSITLSTRSELGNSPHPGGRPLVKGKSQFSGWLCIFGDIDERNNSGCLLLIRDINIIKRSIY